MYPLYVIRVPFALFVMMFWSVAAISAPPVPSTQPAGVRIGGVNPKSNDEALRLGYKAGDLITKINGLPIRSLYELRSLSDSNLMRAKASLSVLPADNPGTPVERAAPADWNGVYLLQDGVSYARYVDFHASAHGDAWDQLVKDGLLAFEQGRPEQAQTLLEKAREAGARDGLTCCALGWLYQTKVGSRAPDMEKARRFLDEAADYFVRNPSTGDYVTEGLVHLYLAFIHKNAKDDEATLAEMRKAHQADARNPAIVAELVSSLHNLGKFRESLEPLQNYLDVYPDNGTLWDLKLTTLRKLFRTDDLMAELKAKIKEAPDNLTYRRIYLAELRKANDHAGCLKEMDRLFEQFGDKLPRQEAAFLKAEYCMTALRAGKASKAIPHAEDLVKSRGQHSDFIRLGLLLTEAGRYSEAMQALKTAESKPTDRQSRYDRMDREIAAAIDKICLHLNPTQLLEYGLTDRAQKVKAARAQSRSLYVILNQYGPAAARYMLWAGIAIAILFILIKMLRRREA